jgi:hypothetical protein
MEASARDRRPPGESTRSRRPGCRILRPHETGARYNSRVTHPVHVITALPLAAMAEYDRPVGIGDLVAVDTTVPVDVPAVAARVRGYYGDA